MANEGGGKKIKGSYKMKRGKEGTRESGTDGEKN